MSLSIHPCTLPSNAKPTASTITITSSVPSDTANTGPSAATSTDYPLPAADTAVTLTFFHRGIEYPSQPSLSQFLFPFRFRVQIESHLYYIGDICHEDSNEDQDSQVEKVEMYRRTV